MIDAAHLQFRGMDLPSLDAADRRGIAEAHALAILRRELLEHVFRDQKVGVPEIDRDDVVEMDPLQRVIAHEEKPAGIRERQLIDGRAVVPQALPHEQPVIIGDQIDVRLACSDDQALEDRDRLS